MTFEEEKKSLSHEIEEILKRYLPKEEGFQKNCLKAMNYSVGAGGKRLRPMLMLLSYRLFGGEGTVIEPFLAAIEMIHTYSLIHDDLPAMDDDDYRRGQEATHKKFGEAIGILAGDALLNYSMETVMKAFLLPGAEANRIAAAIATLYRKSGVYGMIGGQTVDVETDNTGDITREQLDFVYRLKTSALLEASMMIGAILAGAEEESLKTIEAIARDVGIAFQIRDDILDETSTLEKLGKPTGSDEKNKKATYVSFEGIEKAREDVRIMTERALSRLRTLPGDKTFLSELLTALIDREN